MPIVYGKASQNTEVFSEADQVHHFCKIENTTLMVYSTD